MQNIYRQTIGQGSTVVGPAGSGRSYTYYVMPAVLLAVLFIAACGSLSKDECTAADWYSIGVEDGSKGYSMSRLGQHRKACAKVGVSPDADRYSQGRLAGLKNFCTTERGYSEGEKGRRYTGVCPPNLEPIFMQGYLAGQAVYNTKQQIRGLEKQLASVRNETANLRRQLEAGVAVDSSGKMHRIGVYEKRAMLDRLLVLDREEGRLLGEIAGLRQTL